MVQDYLAIMYIGAGSSWARADTAFEAIALVKKKAEQDWGAIYTFSDKPGSARVFDVTGVQDWYSEDGNVMNEETGEKIPYLYSVSLRLQNKRRK